MKQAILFAAAVCTLGAGPLAAQVGYEPSRSPFRDLDFAQELTFYSGYYKAKKDPAQVAPQSGPVLGVHYQWRAGGPVSVTADFSRLATERRVIDPEAPETCAGAGTQSCKFLDNYRWPVYFFIAVAFWNLVGAGLFGFLINPPLPLYFMQGLNLTPLHGHTALFGVYGMLGIGLVLILIPLGLFAFTGSIPAVLIAYTALHLAASIAQASQRCPRCQRRMASGHTRMATAETPRLSRE
mgnify:CR=1 FL=1